MAAGLSPHERPRGTPGAWQIVSPDPPAPRKPASRTLVVGYKKEYFFLPGRQVRRRHCHQPQIRHAQQQRVHLWLVKDHLDNTYVCSSRRLLLRIPFEPYVYKSTTRPRTTSRSHRRSGASKRVRATRASRARPWAAGRVGRNSAVFRFDRVFFREVPPRAGLPTCPRRCRKLWSIYWTHQVIDMVIRRYPDGVVHGFGRRAAQLRSLFMEGVDSEVFDHIIWKPWAVRSRTSATTAGRSRTCRATSR